MKALTYRTAPNGEGWLPCLRCHRYRHPDDLDGGHCRSPSGCHPPQVASGGQRVALRLNRERDRQR